MQNQFHWMIIENLKASLELSEIILLNYIGFIILLSTYDLKIGTCIIFEFIFIRVFFELGFYA